MTKVTGELISVDDSAYDGFKGMTIYGKTVQNLWVNPSGTNNGITVTSNSNGSLTVSGEFSGSGAVNISTGSLYALRPGSTYTVSVDKARPQSGGQGSFGVSCHTSDGTQLSYTRFGGTSSGEGLSVTFAVPANTAFVQCRVIASSGITGTGTYRVMLNEGSEAQPWCPPGLNSVDELSVVTAGKNLFTHNSNTQIQGNGGSNQVTTIGTKVSGIPTQQVVTVSLEYRLSSGAGTMAVQQNGTPYKALGIRYLALIGDGQWHKASGNVTVNDSFNKNDSIGIRLDNVTGLFELRNIQFELGSTATAYEPPNITTTPIDLQGHTLNALPDGTRDELHIDGGGNVVLEKRVHREHIDADDFVRDGAEYCNAIISTPNSAYKGGVTFRSSDQRNDFAPIGNADNYLAHAQAAVYTLNNGTEFRVGDGTQPSTPDEQLASVKAKIGAKGIDAMWALLEPQTIQLGKISLPKLRKKPLVNNVWANGTAEGTGFSLAPEIDYKYNRWSTYCDGFRTHGKHSYFDMGCCIAARDTGTPEKKSVTATVPYMSGFYDLSKLYGAIAFEARELMYRFEFVEDSRDELQQRKSQFLEWLSQVHDEEIADDDIPGRHFIGSLSEWEFEEGEEGQSGSLEVTFNCQPFLEADEDTTKTCNAGSNTVTVAGQAVNVYAKTSSGTATIRIGGVTQSVGTTEIRLSVQLQPGDNAVTVTGSPVVLRWKELTV